MTNQEIVCVDPGKMSGLCSWDGKAAQLWEKPCWEAVRDVEIMLQCGVETIVVEDFIINAHTLRKSRQHWSLESIGALRYLTKRWNKELVIQRPADAKRFGTDKKLKDAALWLPGKEHARDAGRHLLLYLANKNRLGEIL
jgi:hypothetical protein